MKGRVYKENSDLPDYNSFYCKNTRLLTRCEQAGKFYAVIG